MTTSRLDVSTSADLPAIGGGVCPHCEEPVADGNKMCAACGGRVDVNACYNCDAPLAKGAKFCTGCGYLVPSEEEKASGGETPAERIAKREARLGGGAAPRDASAPADASADKLPPEVERAAEVIPIRSGMFTARQIRVLYDGVCAELERRGWPPIGDDAKRECAETMCEVLNFYIHIDEKYSLAARCIIAHVTAFAPGIIVKLIEARRKARGEDASGYTVPSAASPSLRVVKDTGETKTVDGGGAPGEFPPPPREDG